MCITTNYQKYRTEKCRPDNATFNTNFSLMDSFCADDHDSFPWFSPELDIHNQHHVSYYGDNETTDELDVSECNFPNTLWMVASSTTIIIKTSVFVPLVIWGIFANICLIYVIVKNRHLRTPTNMIIGNMATVDLISLLIYPWMFLISDFFQNYQFGAFGCKVDGWWEFSLLLINVMNLSTISYDRLTAIVMPQETRLTRKGAKYIICISWISSLILACPLIIYREYKERQWKNFLEVYCTENTTFIALYWHILLVMAVWLPLAVMILCYSAIFIKGFYQYNCHANGKLKLDRYEQKVLKREHPMSVNYKTKVAKIVFLVVITFIICRVPFTALIFRRNQWLKVNKQDQVIGVDQILWFVARYLIYANAALDPLLYGLTNENFRRAFRSYKMTKVFFPNKKKTQIVGKICVNVIQPRGPYKSENKSDNLLILGNNSQDLSKEKSNISSQKTDKMLFN